MLDIVKQCQDANRIGITGHINPDGDCIGSTVGMWQFLKKVFPQKEIYVLLEQPAEMFHFIKGVSEIILMDEDVKLTKEQEELHFNVMIVIDTVIERTGKAQSYIQSAEKVINIDHHISNLGQGDVWLVDPKASAAAEIVYELLTMNDEYKSYMDRELAQTLYIGIIHDTGVMQYSNTSPKTLRIVAELIAFGFDFTRLIDETFYQRTPMQAKMTGKALQEAYTLLDGKMIVGEIDYETISSLNVTKKELSGIVSQLRYVEGVDVALFMYALKPNAYKISLRSREIVDVAKVCEVFGGGGHIRAAGCSMEGRAKDIIEKIAQQVSLQL